MIVTKVEQQKKDKNRFSVFIDGNFAFGMSYTDLLYYKITEDAEIDEDQYDHLINAVCLDKAQNKAARYLGYGARTEKQVREKLRDDYPVEIIDKVVENCKKYDYINDLDFAKKYILRKSNNNNDGMKKIRYELYRLGVSREDIDEAAQEIDLETTETIVRLLDKKLGIYDYDYKQKQKAINYLMGKGFSYSEIKEGFDAYDEEGREEEDEDEE